MKTLILLGLVAAATLATAQAVGADENAAGKQWVYVGTYTRGDSKGIYLLELDLASARLTDKGLAVETPNPSFLAVHPNRRFLYAVSEAGGAGGKQSGVASFKIDPETGKLTELNRQPSGGGGPCHVALDPKGKVVVVANYGGGSVASLAVNEDGTLKPGSVVQHTGSSVNPGRQKQPHAHSMNVDPAGKFAAAADLGIDKVIVYPLDTATGKLDEANAKAASVKPGSGPRHFAFHPTGKYAYVINELLSTVTAFDYDAAKGELKEIETVSTLPEGFKGNNSTAEVQVHPSGKFLYGSNRGHNSIAVYAIDTATGKLKAVEHESTQGKVPRNFGIDPTGQYLLAANQDSNSVVLFKIDAASGVLTPTGSSVKVPSPVCVKFLPVGGK